MNHKNDNIDSTNTLMVAELNSANLRGHGYYDDFGPFSHFVVANSVGYPDPARLNY